MMEAEVLTTLFEGLSRDLRGGKGRLGALLIESIRRGFNELLPLIVSQKRQVGASCHRLVDVV